MIQSLRRLRRLAFNPSLLLLIATVPAHAQAAGGTGNLQTFLQNFLNMITGPLGQVLSVLAIAFASIGMAFSVIRFHSLVAVIAAIAILFSSEWLVTQLMGSGAGG